MSKLQGMLHFFRLLCCLVFFAGPSSGQQSLAVRIIQEDTIHTVSSGMDQITLQKKSFRIQLLLQHIEGAYIMASFKDSMYSLQPDQPVPGFSDLPNMAMAEENFNREKELIVSDDGWSYWFYDPGLDWHRFNKKITLLDSGRVVGTKTIKQLYVLADQESVKLKDNDKPLYLFFVVPAARDPQGHPVRELIRFRLKINWTDED